MALPLTIQRAPRGVLDLLKMKGSGELPHDLAQELRGVLDLSEYYLEDAAESLPGTTAVVVATGFWGSAAQIVPAGEMWIVSNITIEAASNLGAGETYRFRCAVQRQGTIREIGESECTGTTGERPVCGWNPPRYLILRPGDNIGAYIITATAGAHGFTVLTRLSRILL